MKNLDLILNIHNKSLITLKTFAMHKVFFLLLIPFSWNHEAICYITQVIIINHNISNINLVENKIKEICYFVCAFFCFVEAFQLCALFHLSFNSIFVCVQWFLKANSTIKPFLGLNNKKNKRKKIRKKIDEFMAADKNGKMVRE